MGHSPRPTLCSYIKVDLISIQVALSASSDPRSSVIGGNHPTDCGTTGFTFGQSIVRSGFAPLSQAFLEWYSNILLRRDRNARSSDREDQGRMFNGHTSHMRNMTNKTLSSYTHYHQNRRRL